METTTSRFDGQHFYVGLDIHRKRWVVTIRWQHMELKTFSMDPSAEQLVRYLAGHYPGGHYHSVYEAGFCGFHIHRMLANLGIDNIIVNPADVPRRSSEQVNKSDVIDSRKLARELESRSLKGIYIPDEFHQQLRSLCRLRERLTSESTRWKNRIKSYLAFTGMALPEHAALPHWSNRFMIWLEGLEFTHAPGREALELSIRRLRSVREELVWVLRRLRHHVRTHPSVHGILQRTQSVSGIGFITAITLYTEIIEMTRFANENKLLAFVGLIPSVRGSGEWEQPAKITTRHHRSLRFMLIEAAWVAIRKDPALTERFLLLTRRMPKNEAVIRIAKSLLKRIRHVWMKNENYVPGVLA